jgi:hypothetical protein
VSFWIREHNPTDMEKPQSCIANLPQRLQPGWQLSCDMALALLPGYKLGGHAAQQDVKFHRVQLIALWVLFFHNSNNNNHPSTSKAPQPLSTIREVDMSSSCTQQMSSRVTLKANPVAFSGGTESLGFLWP